MSLKAIETRYNGYRFRSRLEARWAVFFDCMALPWEYEPEGFVLPDGQWYLPDFRVRYPGQGPQWTGSDGPHDVWFEVKPSIEAISDGEWSKLLAFNAVQPLILLDGTPDHRLYMTADVAHASGRRSDYDEGMALYSSKGRLWWDEWDNVYLGEFVDAAFRQLPAAVAAARAARFERRAA